MCREPRSTRTRFRLLQVHTVDCCRLLILLRPHNIMPGLTFDDTGVVVLTMASITDAPTAATTWTDQELARGRSHYDVDQTYNISYSKYNPTPGAYPTFASSCAAEPRPAAAGLWRLHILHMLVACVLENTLPLCRKIVRNDMQHMPCSWAP